MTAPEVKIEWAPLIVENLPWLFALAFGALVAMCLRSIAKLRRIESHTWVDGEVVGMWRRHVDGPISVPVIEVEYVDGDDRGHRIESQGFAATLPDVGSRVRVAYPTGAPERGRIDIDVDKEKVVLGIMAAFFGAIAALAVIIGAILLIT